MIIHEDESVTLHHGQALDVLRTLPDASVNCCVTSPPYYGLRDYGVDGQLGLEKTPGEYVDKIVAVMAEVRRVLASDGTLWLNLGDSYTGSWGGQGKNAAKNGGYHRRIIEAGSYVKKSSHTGTIQPGVPPAKNLLGMPWRVALTLQDDGWILRNAVVWNKPNAMPESVRDRLSTRYEHVFLFSKSKRYWFDLDPIRSPAAPASVDRAKYALTKLRPGAKTGALPGETRTEFQEWDSENLLTKGTNPGDVWSIPTSPFPGAHFATMPVVLAERCILAGCPPGGVVLDPFSGSGTTGLAATRNGRRYVAIDLNRDYLDMSLRTRLAQTALIDHPLDGQEAP